MKKLRNNNKAFALVETLIGALFVVAVFMVLFENYYPIVGKYERYENYDDLESKYIVHYLRQMIEADPNKSSIINKIGSTGYYLFGATVQDGDITTTATPNELCTLLSLQGSFNNKQYCQNFIDEAKITKIFLSDYNTTTFKNAVKNHTLVSGSEEISRAFELYVDYMPTFKNSASSKSGYRRLIIEIKHENNDSSKEGTDYYTYANIEVF